jgi:hypothetical protein
MTTCQPLFPLNYGSSLAEILKSRNPYQAANLSM